MKIDYLFSRNKKIGSKLISWAAKYENLGIKENPSHVAILLNGDLVIESVLGSGVRIVPYSKWQEINEELYKIPCPKWRSSASITKTLMDLWGKKYDWKGIIFFSVAYIKLLLWKIKMPNKNLWERKSYLFCTEFAGILTDSYYGMTSPAKLCKELLEDLDG